MTTSTKLLGGGGTTTSLNTSSSKKSTSVSSNQLFKPLIASSLALALGMSVASATPTITNGSSSINLPQDFTLSTGSEGYDIFSYSNSQLTNLMIWIGNGTINYKPTNDSGDPELQLNSDITLTSNNGISMGTGTLQLSSWASSGTRIFTLNLSSITSGHYAIQGNLSLEGNGQINADIGGLGISGDLNHKGGTNTVTFINNAILGGALNATGGSLTFDGTSTTITNGIRNENGGTASVTFSHTGIINNGILTQTRNGRVNITSNENLTINGNIVVQNYVVNGQSYGSSINHIFLDGTSATIGSSGSASNIQVAVSQGGNYNTYGYNAIVTDATTNNFTLGSISISGTYGADQATKTHNLFSFNDNATSNTLTANSISPSFGNTFIGKNIADNTGFSTALFDNATSNPTMKSDFITLFFTDTYRAVGNFTIGNGTDDAIVANSGNNYLNVTSLSINGKTKASGGSSNYLNAATITMTEISAESNGLNNIFAKTSLSLGGQVSATVSGASQNTLNVIKVEGSLTLNGTSFSASNGDVANPSSKNILDITGTTQVNGSISFNADSGAYGWGSNPLRAVQNIVKFGDTVTFASGAKITSLNSRIRETNMDLADRGYNVLSFEGSSTQSITIDVINPTSALNSGRNGNNYIGKGYTTGSGSTLTLNSALFSNAGDNGVFWDNATHQANVALAVTNDINNVNGVNYINVESLSVTNVNSSRNNYISTGAFTARGDINSNGGSNYIASSGNFSAVNITSNINSNNPITTTIKARNLTLTGNITTQRGIVSIHSTNSASLKSISLANNGAWGSGANNLIFEGTSLTIGNTSNKADITVALNSGGNFSNAYGHNVIVTSATTNTLTLNNLSIIGAYGNNQAIKIHNILSFNNANITSQNNTLTATSISSNFGNTIIGNNIVTNTGDFNTALFDNPTNQYPDIKSNFATLFMDNAYKASGTFTIDNGGNDAIIADNGNNYLNVEALNVTGNLKANAGNNYLNATTITMTGISAESNGLNDIFAKTSLSLGGQVSATSSTGQNTLNVIKVEGSLTLNGTSFSASNGDVANPSSKNILDITGTTQVDGNLSFSVDSEAYGWASNPLQAVQNIVKFGDTVTFTNSAKITSLTSIVQENRLDVSDRGYNLLSFESTTSQSITIDDINPSSTLNGKQGGNNYIGKNFTTGDGSTLALDSNLFSGNNWKDASYQANMTLTITNAINSQNGENYINVASLEVSDITVSSNGNNNIATTTFNAGSMTATDGGNNIFISQNGTTGNITAVAGNNNLAFIGTTTNTFSMNANSKLSVGGSGSNTFNIQEVTKITSDLTAERTTGTGKNIFRIANAKSLTFADTNSPANTKTLNTTSGVTEIIFLGDSASSTGAFSGNVTTSDGSTTFSFSNDGGTYGLVGTLSTSGAGQNIIDISTNNATISNDLTFSGSGVSENGGNIINIGANKTLTLQTAPSTPNAINTTSGSTYLNFNGDNGTLDGAISTTSGSTTFNLGSTDGSLDSVTVTVSGNITNSAENTFNVYATNTTFKNGASGLAFTNGTNNIVFAKDGATLDWQNSSGTTQDISTTNGRTNINFTHSGTIVGNISTNGNNAQTTIEVSNAKVATINGKIITTNTATTNATLGEGSTLKLVSNATLNTITMGDSSTLDLSNQTGTHSADNTSYSFAELNTTNGASNIILYSEANQAKVRAGASGRATTSKYYTLLTIGGANGERGLVGDNATFTLHLDNKTYDEVYLGGTQQDQNGTTNTNQYGYTYSDRIIIESGNNGNTPNSSIADIKLKIIPKLNELGEIAYQGGGTEEKGNIAILTVKDGVTAEVESVQSIEVAGIGTQVNIVSEATDMYGNSTGSGYTTYFAGNAKATSISEGIKEIASTALTVNYDLYLANFNSLNKRMGELRDNPYAQGVWARVYGGAMSNEFGAGSKTEYITTQGGYDYSLSLGDARNYMGIAVAYGHSTTKSNQIQNAITNVGGGQATGLQDVNSNMVEVGIYNSYVMDSGWYNDTIFKFDYIMSSFTMTDNTALVSETNNFAMILSNEFGYRYKFGSDASWYIDPQLEVGFGYFNQSDFNRVIYDHINNQSADVKATQDTILTLRGRAGLSLGKKFKSEKGFASVYVGAFYEYDYIEGGNANASSFGVINAIDSIESNGRAIVNIGSNIELTDGVRMYIDVEKSFGDKQRTDMQFNFGARYSFGEKNPTLSTQEAQKPSVAPLKIEEKK